MLPPCGQRSSRWGCSSHGTAATASAALNKLFGANAAVVRLCIEGVGSAGMNHNFFSVQVFCVFRCSAVVGTTQSFVGSRRLCARGGKLRPTALRWHRFAYGRGPQRAVDRATSRSATPRRNRAMQRSKGTKFKLAGPQQFDRPAANDPRRNAHQSTSSIRPRDGKPPPNHVRHHMLILSTVVVARFALSLQLYPTSQTDRSRGSPLLGPGGRPAVVR